MSPDDEVEQLLIDSRKRPWTHAYSEADLRAMLARDATRRLAWRVTRCFETPSRNWAPVFGGEAPAPVLDCAVPWDKLDEARVSTLEAYCARLLEYERGWD